MKGSADSASSSKLGWVLPQVKKLYWNADSTTNLPKWKVDIVQAAKGAFGIYAECLVKLTIPTVWVDDEYPMISEGEWVAMFDPQKIFSTSNFLNMKVFVKDWFIVNHLCARFYSLTSRNRQINA